MSQSSPNQETEIKLRAPSPAAAAELLTTHGFVVSKSRIYEKNSVFDDEAETLRSSGRLLRVREAGEHGKVTFKGGDRPGRHKVREELETEVEDARVFAQILQRLGYRRTFVYEKHRTEFEEEDPQGTATLDETPIGTFLELEGESAWIDRTAQAMGFEESDYILDSYGALYLRWCAEKGIVPGDMVWPETKAK